MMRVKEGPVPPVATVRTRCPACQEWNAFEADQPLEAIACGRCEAAIPLCPEPRLLEGGPVARCWRCGEADFWTRKDFPAKVGLAIVAVAAVLVFATGSIWPIVIASLFDLALYRVLPWVTVCYVCRTEVRGVPRDPAHGAFDLAHQEDGDEARRAAARGGAAEPGSPPPAAAT